MSYSRRHTGETGSLDGARLRNTPGYQSNRPMPGSSNAGQLTREGIDKMLDELQQANAAHEAAEAHGQRRLSLPAPDLGVSKRYGTRRIKEADQPRRCEAERHAPELQRFECKVPADRLAVDPSRVTPGQPDYLHAWFCELHMLELGKYGWEAVPVRGLVTVSWEPEDRHLILGRR